MEDDFSFTIGPARRERRAQPRYEFATQVTVRHMRTTYVMDVANIGRGGVFIRYGETRTLGRIRVGDELELDVVARDGLDNLRVAARVVHVVNTGVPARSGFGAKFVRTSSRTDARIQQFVDQAARIKAGRPPPLPATGGGSDTF